MLELLFFSSYLHQIQVEKGAGVVGVGGCWGGIFQTSPQFLSTYYIAKSFSLCFHHSSERCSVPARARVFDGALEKQL